MKKLLIPFLFLGVTTALQAQTPENIIVHSPLTPALNAQNRSALPCNAAGTFALGQFIGQSNDTDLDTIYLCFGDSLFIDHNGDSDLSNDPDPATPNGIAWAFYDCPPLIAGDNLQAILADPCLTVDPPPANGIWIARGDITGDIWLQNQSAAQNTFNAGLPVVLHFAPITLDNWALPGYDSLPGFPPGPCVNVNTAAQFAVAYLNPIQESNVTNTYAGDDCLGYFQVKGGLPELMNGTALYNIDVSLAANPEVKALIHLPPPNWFNSAAVPFSVSTPGVYTVTIEDGKSCGTQFQIDMSGCNAADNATIAPPDTVSPPGSTLCVPITVQNFNNLISATFNLGWDPAVIQYVSVQNPNPLLVDFDANSLNEILAANGQLGVNIFDLSGASFTIPDGESLFEVCFNMIGMLDECSQLFAPSSPAVTTIEIAPLGTPTALIFDTALICVRYLPLEVIVGLTDTICFGGTSSATLSITSKGGIPPYSLTWQQVPGGAVNSGFLLNDGDTFLSAPGAITNGTYIIRLTDENGLGETVIDTLVVDFPTLGASLDLTQTPTCFGSCDGEVSANVLVNGSVVPNPNPGAYLFTWSGPGVTQGVQMQDSLCAGNYFVTVTEASSGCSALASGTLSQPTRVRDDSIAVVQASCSGLNDGSIEYFVQGGTPFAGGNYDFNWTYSPDGVQGPFQDQAGISNPFLLNNKAEGIYYVTITDANGCTLEDSVVLTSLRTVDLTAVVTNTSCAGTTDGMIELTVTVTPSDPGDNFFFIVLPPGVGTQDCQTPLTCKLSDLPIGTYNVLAIDNIGCLDTANFVVESPAPLVMDTFAYQLPSCVLQNNGAITVITLGGTGSPMTYQYEWENGATGPSRSNLPVGMYAVTVTDLNGCQDSLSFDLQLPPAPTITGIDSVSVLCGADGCLTVNADSTAVVFTWLDLNGAAVGNTQQVCNLIGGTYIAIVSDDQGCESTDTVTLAGVEPLSISDTTFILPSCFGYTDGRLGITVVGGTPTYNYLWSDPNSQNNPTLFDVPAGDYAITVTDLNGCTLVDTFTLLDPPAIQATYAQVPATCASNCDGQAIPTVNYSDGGTGDFNFVWCDGSSDSTRIDLCPGVCYVTIIDGNNCFLVDSVITDSPDTIGGVLAVTPASCFGLSDGTVGVTASGGNGGPYQYLWSVNNAVTPTVTGLPAGDYTVTVTDAIGCTGEFTAFVTEPDELIVLQDILNTSLPICFGDDNGQLGVNASGGNPGPYTFVWADSSGTSLGTDSILTDIPSGAYFVTVTDTRGCTGTLQNLVLNDPPPIVGNFLPWMELTCFGDETTLFIDTIFGGSGAPYQYSLDFGVLLDPMFPITMDGGQHFITYYDRLNCEITDTIFVFEPDPLLVVFDPASIEIKLGDTLTTLQPQITGALVDTFFWVPAELLSDPTILNPMITTFQSTTYTLTVFDENGCSGTGSIEVEVDPDRNIYIPNVFHPGNTSGLNDRFNVYAGLGVEIVNIFQIYDRWGGLMYENTDFYPSSFDFSEGWDGRYNGDYVNPGVYVYIAEVKFLDGRVLTYRGDVTVIR
ncbi:MAG: gliding motility-associated C-terminal domain-containing protein [Saprospiraceae bacterium]|nr:gliding motility-associated C-terminal domain-containing protein [Saprospiraceae bacterium]